MNSKTRIILIGIGLCTLVAGALAYSAAQLLNVDDSASGSPVETIASAHGAEFDGIQDRDIPLVDGFDFPVGPPDAKKYYNAQGFQTNNHLGEDWNGLGGGNTDLGDPVYATARGVVVKAYDAGQGWGNVIRIKHNIGTVSQPKIIESLYAHLDSMGVQPQDTVQRGQQIGTIGNANGAYWAHLHFEMRHDVELPLGGGYSLDTAGYLLPTAFIKKHRPNSK